MKPDIHIRTIHCEDCPFNGNCQQEQIIQEQIQERLKALNPDQQEAIQAQTKLKPDRCMVLIVDGKQFPPSPRLI